LPGERYWHKNNREIRAYHYKDVDVINYVGHVKPKRIVAGDRYRFNS